ncbi:protein FAM177A1-like isoform X2 [Maniola jurtina]|uniref:protein FAM177A1-like isoform X2 n=1 Tax=Maniola jurtina TaxID=191418 RepID=UPI001E6870E0|nr:protein FAM177A1-like isoform X2 [Maniola jurtina]
MEGVDSEVQVTINRPKRIIHFSDGVEEEIEEEKKNLSWGPWLSHYALKSGSSVLYAVDYAGESLATFFGITTPKYQIEIDEYERIQEEKRKLEEESAGWVPRNVEGEIPLVMSEPLKKEPEQV